MPESTTCSLGCKTRDGHPIRTHDGYSVCDRCADRLRQTVSDIVEFYAIVGSAQLVTIETLMARGEAVQTRKAPFGSRSPVSDHLIALRDHRTAAVEPGDPHSPLAILWGWAQTVREDRNLTATATQPTVTSAANTLLFHWDWVMRQSWVDDMAQELREVLAQLRHTIGIPKPKPIGRCPTVLDDSEPVGVCDALLFAPVNGDSVECRSCGREWPRSEWLWLGTLLTQGAA